jgi:hypothetical protein
MGRSIRQADLEERLSTTRQVLRSKRIFFIASDQTIIGRALGDRPTFNDWRMTNFSLQKPLSECCRLASILCKT